VSQHERPPSHRCNRMFWVKGQPHLGYRENDTLRIGGGQEKSDTIRIAFPYAAIYVCFSNAGGDIQDGRQCRPSYLL
jgi:hypothetical protein